MEKTTNLDGCVQAGFGAGMAKVQVNLGYVQSDNIFGEPDAQASYWAQATI